MAHLALPFYVFFTDTPKNVAKKRKSVDDAEDNILSDSKRKYHSFGYDRNYCHALSFDAKKSY